MLELGSGGGFFREFAPYTITSECVPVPRVDRVIDACRITEHFGPDSLDAITAFNVFHHLPDCEGFRRGAQTVLRPGGRIVLIEPWFTPLGQWFYRAIHHEPSLLDPDDWNIAGVGRLEGANSRLPTSVFRDSDSRFAPSFPALRVVKREPFHKWLTWPPAGCGSTPTFRAPSPAPSWPPATRRILDGLRRATGPPGPDLAGDDRKA